MRSDTANAIREALALDGFRPVVLASGLEFHGELNVRGLRVPVRLVYPDSEASSLPTLYVVDPAALPRPVVPHLIESGDFCVVDRAAYVADRYQAAEQARGYVVRAAQVLEESIFGKATEAIAAEFPQHWGGRQVGVEFGAYEGFAELYLTPRRIERVRKAQAAVAPPGRAAYVVSTLASLSFAEDQARPNTFGEVLDWAGRWDASLPAKLIAGLGKLSSADPTAIINAPNGTVGLTVRVSSGGPKTVEAMQRSAVWNTVLSGKAGPRFRIERLQGHRVDLEHILGRNGPDGAAPLGSKQVLLVGCGAIGGFLSHSLAQLGAGIGEGELRLIDPDTLSASNIRRHRLGEASVGEVKAAACRASIQANLPGAVVGDVRGRIEANRHQFDRADLVVDATGEQAVGELLNAWRLELLRGKTRAPMLLHAWIEGNGAAARTFLNSQEGYGCFRCLDPQHQEQARYRVLRPEAPRILTAACGESPTTPYGPAAPMAAAALAAQHAAEWAMGRGRPLMRTIRLDLEITIESKPVDPPKSPHCPACSP